MTDPKSLADQSEVSTPDDVATLYSWANLHGAKYRDFSASRAQAREESRVRVEEARAAEERKENEEAERKAQEEAQLAARLAAEAAEAVRQAEQDRLAEIARQTEIERQAVLTAQEAQRLAAEQRAWQNPAPIDTYPAGLREAEQVLIEPAALAGYNAGFIAAPGAGGPYEPPAAQGSGFAHSAASPEYPAQFAAQATGPADWSADPRANAAPGWGAPAARPAQDAGSMPYAASNPAFQPNSANPYNPANPYAQPMSPAMPQAANRPGATASNVPASAAAQSRFAAPHESQTHSLPYGAPAPFAGQPPADKPQEAYPSVYSGSGYMGEWQTAETRETSLSPSWLAPELPAAQPAPAAQHRAFAPSSAYPPSEYSPSGYPGSAQPSSAQPQAPSYPVPGYPTPAYPPSARPASAQPASAHSAPTYSSPAYPSMSYPPPAPPNPSVPYGQQPGTNYGSGYGQGNPAEREPRNERYSPPQDRYPQAQYPQSQEARYAPEQASNSSGSGMSPGMAARAGSGFTPVAPESLHAYRDREPQAEESGRERPANRWFALKSVFDPQTANPEPTPSPAPGRVPVLAVFSLAGGVGKTSLVASLGRALSSLGERVLLVDTASFGLLPFFFGARDQRPGMLRTFSPPGGGPGGIETPIQLVTLDPEGPAPDELELNPGQDPMQLRSEDKHQDWFMQQVGRCTRGSSRVLIDLPTASGATTRRVLRLAPAVLVPILPDMNSVVSVGAIEAFFRNHGNLAGKPTMPYYLLNQFDSTLPLHQDVREILREQIGDRLLPFSLRRSGAVSEALAEGMTVIDYAPNVAVAEDYAALAAWLRSLSAPAQAGHRGVRWSER